ncbi:MAG TPA: hypothetical protein PLQ29_13090 [Spirochaetales bacterium]|nr:hypothetical protein [Spirochaetales bacterium]
MIQSLPIAIVAVLGVTLVCPAPLGAQERQAVVRVSPFTAVGVGSSEAAMLERLVVSYIVETRSFRVVDAQGQDRALVETEAALSRGETTAVALPLTADFIVNGSIGRIGELFVLSLEVTRVSDGIMLSVADTAESISDIVLRARASTRRLFGLEPTGGLPTAASPATFQASADLAASATQTQAIDTVEPEASAMFVDRPSVSDISGTWRGDKGLETVRIFPNGAGLAVLSGGGTLKLRVTIRGGEVVIAQDQANDAALYKASSVSFAMAKAIAERARPMRWVFRLDATRDLLSGMKESVAVSYSGDEQLIDNDNVREASWTRISR